MKKTLALLIGIFLASCNATKSQPETTAAVTTEEVSKTKNEETLCEQYAALGNDVSAQTAWLNAHRSAICDASFYTCVLQRHDIPELEHKTMKTKYWGTRTPLTNSFKWSFIKNKIDTWKCTDNKYVGFDITNEKVTGLKQLNGFTTSETCYSVTLFNAIGATLSGNDDFVFTLGKDSSNNTSVIFSIKKNSNTNYYDLTIDPSFTLLSSSQ